MKNNTIQNIRRFSRFYTSFLGLLNKHILNSDMSLIEARVLYEIHVNAGIYAKTISMMLQIDKSYLSRIIKKLHKSGLIRQEQDQHDGRSYKLYTTKKGAQIISEIEHSSDHHVSNLIRHLNQSDQRHLVSSMRSIENLLDQDKRNKTWDLHTYSPGDIGWIIHRHGVLYAQEYQFDASFEGFVAGLAGEFLLRHSEKEQCWVAKQNDKILGSVFLVDDGNNIARLRMLYVEPSARGLGIGETLLNTAIQFARDNDYQAIILSTFNILHAARRIYEKHDFRMKSQKSNKDFSQNLVWEEWQKDL